ncbi:MAG: Na/Pi cotransporter family protein [Candidatus Sulfomarinibacteraceae bacterium]
MNAATTLDIGVLVTQLGGGLALFLFGMRQMTESLKTVAGAGMKNLLARLTANRFTAAFAGMIITAVIQSSSVTTVLVVGFVSAGLLNLSQSIGVILGANVGTTVTAQIIAFKVYQYGLLMIAVGFFTEIAARREYLRQWGTALMGLGLIFFGMELMSLGTEPLREWPPFIEMMQSIENPLLSVAIGAAFTAIVQSSSATTGIVIVLASQGLISLDTGIGLIFGSNIGTCITAFISAVGRPREALQAAWAHVIFNVIGVMLWVFFIPQFADLVRTVSPVSQAVDGVAGGAADTARQIANAHTIFNVANLILFIGFTGPLSRLVTRIVPERPKPAGIKPQFLDDIYLEQPAMALDQVRRELARLGSLVRDMLGDSLQVTTSGTEHEVARLERADNDVDTLYRMCIQYLGKVSQENLVLKQPQQLGDFIGIANYLENIGDVIEKDLLGVARKRLRNGTTISPSTMEKLKPIDTKVFEAFDDVVTSLATGERDGALKTMNAKQAVNDLAKEATAHLSKRLVADEPGRLEAFQIETDIIEDYRRIHVYSRRIAKLCLKQHPGVLYKND